jgi:type I restriction enzyme, S subunit
MSEVSGWTTSPLGECCLLITDGTHHSPKNGPVGDFKYVTAKNIKRTGLDLTDITYIDATSHAEIYERCPVRLGDILYIKDGATTGIAVVNPLDEPFSLLSSVALIRPNPRLLSNEYLCHLLNSPKVLSQMTGDMTGSAIRRLTLTTITRQSISICPIPEQSRIVAKIDSLSAKSKRARDQLDHVPRLVEKYKQAILAAAFRGELVGLSAASTDRPDPKCWDLPSGWRWVSFSEIAEIASNLVKPETIPDLPHIAPDNVEGGTGRLLPYRTIKEDGVISSKHRFRRGQLIYSKIRPYLRKAIIADFEGACSADMYPLTPNEGVCGRYLLYWLISEQFAGFTVEHEGRTVLPKINQVGLNRTPFPLAPLETQQAIAERIEEGFRWIDRLAAEATIARKLINHLDQAVLAKAFQGELVPQDPSDEPASVLLERIRAERTASATPTERARS